jgi:uncharacterized membrane protein YhdT
VAIVSAVIARIIAVFGILWLALAAMTELAAAPLYAFYPGAMASNDPHYNAKAMYAFGITCGVAYLALLVYAFIKKNRRAAISFVILFFISCVVLVLRVAAFATTVHKN